MSEIHNCNCDKGLPDRLAHGSPGGAPPGPWPRRRRGGRLLGAVTLILLVLAGIHCSDDSTQPPVLRVDPAQIEIAPGDTAGAFTVSNAGQGDMSWSVESEADWLTFDPSSGTTTSSEPVSVEVDRAAVTGGTYEATAQVSSNGGSAAITVRLVSALVASPDRLVAAEDDTALVVELVNIGVVSGIDTLRWTAGTAEMWIELVTSSGTLTQVPMQVTLNLERAGLGAGEHEGQVWFDAGPDGRDTVNVVMAVASVNTVSGHVYYPGTRIPVPQATVSLGDRLATSDDLGYYELTGVTLGPLTLRAEREGFDPYEATLQLPEDGLEQDIFLATDEHAHAVIGMVENSLEEPLRQAQAVLLNPDGTDSAISAVTDATGGFELTEVPDGVREVRVTHPVYQTRVLEIETGSGGQPLDVVLMAEILPPPLPESGPVLRRIDCSTVRILWDRRYEDTLAGYRLERAPSSAGPFVDIGGLISPAVSSFDDEDLQLAIYTYRLRSVTIDGAPGEPSPPRGIELVPWVRLTEGGGSNLLKRWGHQAFYHEDGNVMLVHAGVDCAPSGTCESFRDMWALDLETYEWSMYDTGSSGPTRRHSHSLIHREASGEMVVFAGRNEFVFYSDLHAFNPATRAWRLLDSNAGEAGKRYGHSAIYDPAADRMIIYGGEGDEVHNDVWAYDFGSGSWSLLWEGGLHEADGPGRRARHCAVYDPSGHRMIVHGGWTGSGGEIRADTWSFDLATYAWTPLAEGPRAWQGHSATLVDGQMVVCGEPDWESENFAWAYDLATDAWRAIDQDLDDAPPLRQRHSAIYIPGDQGIVIYGGLGIFDPIGTLSDAWAFCPVR